MEAPGVERCTAGAHLSATSLARSLHLHAREQFFFLALGLHTVLLSSSTCDGLLFQDFITTYSARGLVAVFTETGVHGALDRDRPVRIGT